MRWLPILTLLVASLAGCTDDTPDVANDTDPCVVESAADYSCAQLDANKTADQVAHVHNYWGGAESLHFLNEERYTGDSVLSSCDPIPVEQFLPEDGATVLQGTGQLDIQMSASYRATHASGPLELWVKRADQASPGFVAEVDDGFVTMEILQNASDLPHQLLSAWEFWVYANPDPRLDPPGCRVMARADVTLTVDIHKTLDIVPFPGHPDHWGNETEMPILDAFATYHAINIGDGPSYCTGGSGSHGDGSCFMHGNGFGPVDQIIALGTTFIALTLTLDRDPNDLGGDMGLRYHDATTREWTIATSASSRGDVMTFEIPVEGVDGPYSEQSQWRFQVFIDNDHNSYDGAWTLVGTAYRET